MPYHVTYPTGAGGARRAINGEARGDNLPSPADTGARLVGASLRIGGGVRPSGGVGGTSEPESDAGDADRSRSFFVLTTAFLRFFFSAFFLEGLKQDGAIRVSLAMLY